MENIYINPGRSEWRKILARPVFNSRSLENIVSDILGNVKEEGDKAVRDYSLAFDGIALNELKVSGEEITVAVESIDENLKQSIRVAANNIRLFHESQKDIVKEVETSDGVLCWRKSIGIEKVGLYIPGGTAPLFSTLLMLGIPAVMAGCRDIMVCTPPGKDGKINPVILFVAHLIGLKNIYKAGGAQAIGAMAYGTETIPAVYKIFGPGNQYVTCAKQLINKEGISIDLLAGPSEVAIYADKTSNPSFIAADLLSQAEHGIDSQVLLIADTESVVNEVRSEIINQLHSLSRRSTAEAALKNSRFIVMSDPAKAFELLNEYAPEHLIIASDEALKLAANVINAGSVFLGHYSPESAGDYATGTNHTLPTNGYAKAYSGVSLDSFVKKITFQQLNKKGLLEIGPSIEKMALAEGLDAHKNSITIRLNEINKWL